MPPATVNTKTPLTQFGRLMQVALAVVLASLLLTARAIEPNASGFGTHVQLGLGECFVVHQWGVRCPTCGMTTAWANVMRGELSSAVSANAGGVVLCICTIVAIPWLLANAAIGRWCYLRPHAGLVLPPCAVVVLVIFLDWARHTGLPLLWEQFPYGSY